MKKIINEAVIASEAKQSQTFRLLRPVHHVGRPRNDGQVLVHFALFVIRIYQRLVSPYLGAHCRFVPSCSEYAGEAIRRHGFFKGLTETFARLLRCHPLHAGGHDPVSS